MIESDTFLEPTKYKIRYQCDLCGHNYTRTYKVIPKVDPACPSKACQTKQQLAAMKKEMENLKRMVEAGAAPAQTGGNVRVQAVDETAKIVMEDYQMSDLRDGIRPGESVAPKLPPAQQAAADNYFGNKGLQRAGISPKQAEMLGRRAMSGAFRNSAVAPNQVLPTNVRNGESPLRVIGQEKLK
jgi:hypothetical protein